MWMYCSNNAQRTTLDTIYVADGKKITRSGEPGSHALC